MSRSSYPLKLPETLKRDAQRLAKQDGVSLNQWIAAAVARQVGASEEAEGFFERRAARARRGAMLEILAKTPDRPPDAGDELPEGLDSDTLLKRTRPSA